MKNKGGLLLLIAIVIGLLWWMRSSMIEGFQAQIPAILWTYWNQEELPDVVQLCIESWRKNYPEMDIRIVTPSTLKKYTDLDPKKIAWNDIPARESDIIRISLLAKYGGYWSDATNYFTARVDFPMRTETEFVGYYIDGPTTDKKYPVIENWFFGTIPGGQFMTRWRDTFMSIGKYGSVGNFLEAMKQKGVDFQGIESPEYLAMHIAAQAVLQEMGSEEIQQRMVLLKAEDGPFAYLAANNFGSYDALKDLCNGNHRTAMIKFRGAERGILEKDADLRKCIFTHSG